MLNSIESRGSACTLVVHL